MQAPDYDQRPQSARHWLSLRSVGIAVLLSCWWCGIALGAFTLFFDHHPIWGTLCIAIDLISFVTWCYWGKSFEQAIADLRKKMVIAAWSLLGFIVVAIVMSIVSDRYEAYESQREAYEESHQQVDHDTPIWIQGDWLVGEYRVCQMRTKRQLASPESSAKLPRLFCGQDSSGVVDFLHVTNPALQQTAIAPESVFAVSMTSDALDSYFHVLPVKYVGSMFDYVREDKWITSWRCQRLNESLECKAVY